MFPTSWDPPWKLSTCQPIVVFSTTKNWRTNPTSWCHPRWTSREHVRISTPRGSKHVNHVCGKKNRASVVILCLHFFFQSTDPAFSRRAPGTSPFLQTRKSWKSKGKSARKLAMCFDAAVFHVISSSEVQSILMFRWPKVWNPTSIAFSKACTVTDCKALIRGFTSAKAIAKKRCQTKWQVYKMHTRTHFEPYITEKNQDFSTCLSKNMPRMHADLDPKECSTCFTSSANLRFASRSSEHANIAAWNNAATTERRGPWGNCAWELSS